MSLSCLCMQFRFELGCVFHFLFLYHALCRFEHILSEDAVAAGGIVHQHVGDGADELAILYDRRAAHECVKWDTTTIFEVFLCVFYLKIRILIPKHARFNLFRCILSFRCRIANPL